MKINRVNIGEIIRYKVEEAGLTKSKFAEKIGVARQNVEKTIFQKHGIDSDMLCVISEVLNCNLFNYYSDQDSSNNTCINRKELKAKLTIEFGEEIQDRTYRFVFGKNDIEIINK